MRCHKSTEIQDALNLNKPDILAAASDNIPILNRQEDLSVGSGCCIIDDTTSQVMKGHDCEICNVHPAILDALLSVAKNPPHHQASIQLGTEGINN
jgi:hypothetical protein